LLCKKIVIKHKTGLHARPAAVFVDQASQFESAITIMLGEREANAKSIISVMTLGVGPEEEIIIKAEGVDEEEAISRLVMLIENDFII